MGGKTAMTLALNHPESLAKLIVVDISPRYYTPHHQDVIAGISAINLETLISREEADKIMAEFLPEIGVRQFLLKNLYRNEAGGFAWRMNFRGIVSQIENIGEESKGIPFYKPTLFLNGGNSNYIKQSDHELILKLFPKAQLHTIADSGHWVQAEKPKEFVEEILTFLA